MTADAPEPSTTEPIDPSIAKYEVTDAKSNSARKWFDQAKKLVDQRNYDYAIKSFTEGLSLDPEAVEDGFIPLRGCGVARWQTGGKKPGMRDSVKHTMTTKDPIKGMVNAAWLLAHDPQSASYAEGLLKNANKAHCDRAALWVAPILRENLGIEKKPQPKKFSLLKEICEQVGDRCQARGEAEEAVKAFEFGLEALATQQAVDPKNRNLGNIIRDLSTKLTILKGNYQSADSFRDSVQDSDDQARLHDEERLVQSDERLTELVEKARTDMDDNPEVEAKVISYVNLLCKDESEAREAEAINLLIAKYKEADNYRFKQRADDIAIRQMGRKAREAKKSGDTDTHKELLRRRLGFELKTYKERVSKYPTDLRLKHDYARRLFQSGKFDDAIPLFQQARSEPKARHSCSLFLGRCFFQKNLYSQAASILSDAIDKYELTEDDMAKELNYWLGRAYEEDKNVDLAGKTYGKLLEIDYNYRDVRSRLEALK
ncbi:MAG: tetratricopeptide repeat protein [Planctomycetes bacterium]|nr:tetratricopeptide repeat protein [Planctomycetota bacterium]